MTSAPMVSIGLPFFNPGKFLYIAAASVFAQYFGDWELVLVDDGSTDGSLSVAQRIRDPRVRVYSDGARRGLAERLNEIAREAKGKYLARLDADDFMHPDRLCSQVSRLEECEEMELCGGSMFALDRDNVPIGVREARNYPTSPYGVMLRPPLAHATVIGRREWFVNNPYNVKLWRAEDYELWCRTIPPTRWCNVEEPVYYYRCFSSFGVKKYVRSTIAGLRAILMHGPGRVGRVRTAWLLARRVAKMLAHAGGAAFGLTDFMLRSSMRRMTRAERERAEAGILAVMECEVPGVGVPAEVIATSAA